MYSGEDLKGKQLPDDKDVSIITIIREEKTGCLALIGIIFGLATILTIAIVSYVIAGRGKVIQMALNCHFFFKSMNKTKGYDIQCVNQPYQKILFCLEPLTCGDSPPPAPVNGFMNWDSSQPVEV